MHDYRGAFDLFNADNPNKVGSPANAQVFVCYLGAPEQRPPGWPTAKSLFLIPQKTPNGKYQGSTGNMPGKNANKK